MAFYDGIFCCSSPREDLSGERVNQLAPGVRCGDESCCWRTSASTEVVEEPLANLPMPAFAGQSVADGHDLAPELVLQESAEPSELLSAARRAALGAGACVADAVLDFEVSLWRGVELGIDVSHLDHRTLLITRVHTAGSVSKHNKKCRSGGAAAKRQEIICGDRILEVNKVRGHVQKMISKIKTDEELQFTLRRLEEVTVHVTLPSVSLQLGLQSEVVATVADAMSLEVTWVHGSLVMSPMAIEKGDRIVAVNGHRGDSMRLSWELEDSKVPAELVIRRFKR